MVKILNVELLLVFIYYYFSVCRVYSDVLVLLLILVICVFPVFSVIHAGGLSVLLIFS